MKLIVCLDDNRGMAFNQRRQSSDKAVVEKILEFVGDSPLRMDSYTAYLFPEKLGNIQICDDGFTKAGAGDFCFVENVDVSSVLQQAEMLVIFYWNRKYPADLYFPQIPADFQRRSREEFSGNSHSNITMEVYCR